MAVPPTSDVQANGIVEAPDTHFLILRSGRRLAYSEFGDPTGIPIIHQHGMPGSRLEREAEPGLCRALGVRFITPDRPGYGLSDPNPHRLLLDWPSDIAELADSLGIAKFGVLGLSGGGIYALACAAAIPRRLTDVVVTGCPAPMQRPGALTEMRFLTRAGVLLGAHAPWLLNAGATVLSPLIRRFPSFFVDHFNDGVPEADRRWLSMPSVNRGAAATLREALRQGVWGYVHDIGVLATPWGFDLEDIDAPVHLWHGDQDSVIPLRHGHYLASVIPGATLRICPGEGHMLMWNHLPEILVAAAGMRSQPESSRRLPALVA
jgi:pimeloyl-ACP methyl ester carboxylesterase